jgi:hypothetical protein
LALGTDDAGFAGHLEMMGHGRLLEVEQRHQLADTD